MAKKNSNVRRISDKKKNRPKIRFNIWMLIIIFTLSFAGCFIIFMVAANLDENFFDDESAIIVDENKDNPSDDNSGTTETSTSGIQDSTEPTEAVKEIIYPVPESAAADTSYLESCCLITDSTLLGFGSYTDFKDVIGNAALTAATANSAKVESNYGTITIYEVLKLKKPMNVYLMLGSDIGVSDTNDMIKEYMTLVSNLKSALPDMNIYIMQLPPVPGDSEKNTLINEYNERLLSLAKTCGVYCLDTNTGFKNNEGNLNDNYINTAEDAAEKPLTDKYYKDICGYILTHTA